MTVWTHTSRKLASGLLLAAMFGLSACSKSAMMAEKRMAAPVLTAKVEVKDVPVQLTDIGTVEAYSTVSLKSLVAGVLDHVHFAEGEEVRQDALLFTVDPRPFQAVLQRAEANMARDTAQMTQAEANVRRDQANAENAAADQRRYEVLLEKGVIARQVYDQYSTTADALHATVAADQAAVENARETIRADQAAIEAAKLDLQNCYIHAPIAGRTGSLLVHSGNIVKSNDTVLAVINQVQPIYVGFSLPQQDLAEIRLYQTRGKVSVEANLPGDSRPPVRGELSFLDNTVNTATGTIYLKAIFENADKRLWPGQFVNVAVTLTVERNAIVVPSSAIQTGQSGQFVFVVKPDMTVESRPVSVARILGEQTVVGEGLRAGEAIVTDGQIRLVPGALVQIKGAQKSG